MDESDVELLIALQAGERWAFDACYSRYSGVLANFAWSRLRSIDLVEDALQDTFLTAWKRRHQVVILDESLLPWLMVVCRNHISNLQRRQRKHLHAPLSEGDTSAAPELGSGTHWIQEEIRKLSEVDQRVVQLCLVEGLTYREAANALESTPAAVGKRLQRSRARLKRALSEQ